MSNLRSTPVRDACPNRRDSTMPKLQYRGRRSGCIYLASTTPGFTRASDDASRISASNGTKA
jgi:hypothetical protein